jgi:spore coat protein B
MRTPDFQSLLGKTIKINKGGSESRTGLLLAVKPDHLVLQSAEDGISYYHTDHIKSVIGHTKDEFHAAYVQKTSKNNENTPEAAASGQPEAVAAVQEAPVYPKAENYAGLLQGLQYSWVRINRGGPESIEGVLVESTDRELTLVVNQEVYRIPVFHMRNIGQIVAQAQQAQQESTEDASVAAGNQENQAETSTESNGQQSANEKNREKRNRDYIRASSRSNTLNSRSSREQSESTANLPRRLSQTLHFLSDTLSVPLDDLAAPYQRRRF